MAKRLRLLRAHGITRDPWRRAQTRTLGHYDVVEPGWKANLADLQAAAALPKIGRIDEFRAHRADLVERYDAGLAPLAGIEPIGRPGYGVHAHHLYVIRIDPALAGADRDRYAAAMGQGLAFPPPWPVPGSAGDGRCPKGFHRSGRLRLRGGFRRFRNARRSPPRRDGRPG